MDFFNQTGKLAIGSRLRMLTDKITVDAAAIYKMFGIDLKPNCLLYTSDAADDSPPV